MKNKFELEHIGINTANAEEAANLAQLLSTIFNLEPRHGQKSEFGRAYFECMKAPFLGKNGHIAMRTPDLTAAMEELKEKGFTFNMDTAAYFEDGRIKNVYLFRRDELERFRPSPNLQANAGKYPHSHPYPLRFSG